MTVDEILATGQYADKRGREWRHIHGDGRWFHEPDGMWFKDGKKVIKMVHAPQMRLLIERDQHRAVCEGIAFCESHPVYRVVIYDPGEFVIFVSFDSIPLSERETLPEAIDSACWLAESDAARALAVGE